MDDSELECAVSELNLDKVRTLISDGHIINNTSALFRAFVIFFSKSMVISEKIQPNDTLKKIFHSLKSLKLRNSYSENYLNFCQIYNVIKSEPYTDEWMTCVLIIKLLLSQQAVEIYLWVLNKTDDFDKLIEYAYDIWLYNNTTNMTNINHPVNFMNTKINDTLLHTIIKHTKNISRHDYMSSVIISTLISLNADPNITNYLDETPLYLATKNNLTLISKVLIKKTKNINMSKYNCNFMTPLYWSIVNRNHEIYNLLLLHGARYNNICIAMLKWIYDDFESVHNLYPLTHEQILLLLYNGITINPVACLSKLEIIILAWINDIDSQYVVFVPIILCILEYHYNKSMITFYKNY